MAIEIRLLGRLEVLRDGVLVGPGPETIKPRTLLALLAIHANQVLPKALLTDRIWQQPPATARNLVEKYVSAWRRVLDPARIETVGSGYRLHLDPEELDLAVYRHRLELARALTAAGDHAAAADTLDEALAMWHVWDVRAFAEELLPPSEAQLMGDLHLQGLEEWGRARLTIGRDQVAEPLRRSLERNPYRERLAELLMWAYALEGNHTAATEVYQRTREVLADDLGQRPGDALRLMHARVVRRDESLGGHPPQVERAPAQVSNLPPRWQRFTGRAVALQQLASLLLDGQARRPVHGVAVIGGVGVGKTALALEFAARHAPGYDLVWVINAPTRTSVLDGLEALAQRLGCPPPSDRGADLDPLWSELRRRSRWLLVLNNVGAPVDLHDCLPPQDNGSLIVTTLDPEWGRYLRTLELDVLSLPETVDLLRDRGVTGPDGCLAELAAELDGLPLACEQAAAFVRQTGIDCARYLALFRARREELLDRDTPDDHRGTIEASWRLARTQLTARRDAVELAMLCAALAPEDIPLPLLAADRTVLPPALAAAVGDRLAFEDAIRQLRRFSLLTRAGERLRMHRLVQAVVVGSRHSPEAEVWRRRAAQLLLAAAPVGTGSADRPVWQHLVPHITALATELDVGVSSQPDFVDLLHRTSDYLVARGSLDEAQALLECTLTVIETGSQRPAEGALVSGLDLGHTWMELGDVLLKSGKARPAVQAHENAIGILRRHYPPDHPTLARSVAGLTVALTCHQGVSLWHESDLPDVEARFESALAVLQAAMGPDHPVVAVALSGLGQVRQDRGDVDAGVVCQEAALNILTAAYGPDHPDVGHVYGKLGFALALCGDYPRSRWCQEESLRVLSATFGEDHPETGWPLSNLGVMHLEAGDVASAVAFLQRARSVFAAIPGQEVAVLITDWRLARAHLRADRPQAAARLLEHVVPALYAALGEGHADVVAACADLEQARQAAATDPSPV